MRNEFRARVTSQLRLALLSDCGCLKTLAELEQEARASGLTGAEIDAALAGRSFEARTAAALSYACAIKANDPDRVTRAQAHAIEIGVSEADLRAFDDEINQILKSDMS